ncbi:unnamed protein product [Closterium sp. NIES-54]
MLALCQEHRLEHRTKHIALRYFLARELQQRGQLRLAYVASQANTADVFTKFIHSSDFFSHADVYVEASPPTPRWGQPDDCAWDESTVGADDDVPADEQPCGDGEPGGDGETGSKAGTEADVFPKGVASAADDDGVETWWRDAPRETMPIPTYPLLNRKRPHPSVENRDARPPSPRHKPTQHKRASYTSREKLKWLVQLEVAASISEVVRESGIHRKCLTEWKQQA